MPQSPALSSSPWKVVIVGAGIHGLAAAKTYLEINPEIQLTIIDADSTVGGVWSKSRVYAGLTCDVPVPTFEFSDSHMNEEFNIPKWSDLPGATMHEYLERYAKKFDILRRCMFNTEVISIERCGKGWKLFTKVSGSRTTDGRVVVTCDKLIMASGLCSKPYIPGIDASAFEGIILHAKDLHKCHDDLVSEKVKSVIVVGSHKSSVEAGAICAKAGKTVHWLVRENGIGPALFLNAKLPNGKSALELSLCRVMEFGTPTIFGYRGWWDTFFLSGKSALGTKLFNRLQDNVTAGSIGDRYEKSENMRRLKPDICNIFWNPGALAVVQYVDFLSFPLSVETLSPVSESMFQNLNLAVWKDDVAKQLDSDAELEFIKVVDEGKSVHVARTSITKVDSKTVTLSNGDSVKCDAIIFATGWEPSTNELFSPTLKAELGLQLPVTDLKEEEAEYWKGLEVSADKQVLDIYPMLANPPSGISISPELETPHRMLRGIIPSQLAAKDDRSIIFLGQLITVQHCTIAEVGSLWGIAYLEGMLPLGNQEAMDWEIALMNRFMKRRYPGRRNVPFVVGEVRDWMDMMLKDLRVRTDRNRLAYERSPDEGWGWFGWKAWWKEWFLPYEPAVYQGIVQEFLEKFRSSQGEGKKLR